MAVSTAPQRQVSPFQPYLRHIMIIGNPTLLPIRRTVSAPRSRIPEIAMVRRRRTQRQHRLRQNAGGGYLRASPASTTNCAACHPSNGSINHLYDSCPDATMRLDLDLTRDVDAMTAVCATYPNFLESRAPRPLSHAGFRLTILHKFDMRPRLKALKRPTPTKRIVGHKRSSGLDETSKRSRGNNPMPLPVDIRANTSPNAPETLPSWRTPTVSPATAPA